jgi:outer membrane protein OmpA-like peptidoglycan-associated protein
VTYRALDPTVSGAWTAQSTDPTSGRFRSYEFPVGVEVEVEINHPLYEPRRFARVIPEGEDGIRIRLQPRQNIALLSGRVVDTVGEPLPATLYIGGEQYEVDPLTSEFSIELEPGRYTLTAVADGHVSQRESLELAPGPLELELSLEPLAEGKVAVLRGDRIDLSGERITFVDNGEVLDPVAEELLDQVAGLLRQYPDIRLQIVAHGDDRSSVELTERQAQAVLGYLVGQGIDASRLEATGMGSERPIFPNISERNRMRNRRVELLFAE